MSEVDSTLATMLTDNLLYIVVAIIAILVLRQVYGDLRKRFFAWFMNVFAKKKNPKYEEHKKELFSSLSGMTSHDPEMRKNNTLKILEIGVGTGTNFEYYPEGCHLVVVDPNPHFSSYYNENRKKFPNIKSEEIMVTTVEEMDQVPDNSVDVVVMTLVMCSVDDAERALKQIHRVLAPGGKFFFNEHIREWDVENHGLRLKVQNILTNYGIWPFLFDGCCLNRDMLSTLESVGFSSVNGERYYAPVPVKFFLVIQPHLKGTATK